MTYSERWIVYVFFPALPAMFCGVSNEQFFGIQDMKQPKLPVVTFLESPRLYTPERSFEEESVLTGNKNDILEELKTWRMEYSK